MQLSAPPRTCAVSSRSSAAPPRSCWAASPTPPPAGRYRSPTRRPATPDYSGSSFRFCHALSSAHTEGHRCNFNVGEHGCVQYWVYATDGYTRRNLSDFSDWYHADTGQRWRLRPATREESTMLTSRSARRAAAVGRCGRRTPTGRRHQRRRRPAPLAHPAKCNTPVVSNSVGRACFQTDGDWIWVRDDLKHGWTTETELDTDFKPVHNQSRCNSFASMTTTVVTQERLEPVGTRTEQAATSTSKSAVSRRFVAQTETTQRVRIDDRQVPAPGGRSLIHDRATSPARRAGTMVAAFSRRHIPRR